MVVFADCCLVPANGVHPGHSPSFLPPPPPALLSNQVLLNPVQTEEKPSSPPAIQHDTEAEKQLIREVRLGADGRVGGQVGPAGDHLQNDVLSPPSPWGWHDSLPSESHSGQRSWGYDLPKVAQLRRVGAGI